MIVKLLSEHHLEFSKPKKRLQMPHYPITSLFFRPQPYFYWMSPFSLESHLTGEPCDYFLFSIIIAQNNVFCMHILHCLVSTNQYLE